MLVRFTLSSSNAYRDIEMPCVPRVGEAVQWDTINGASRETLTETSLRVEEVAWHVIEISEQPSREPQITALVFLAEDPDAAHQNEEIGAERTGAQLARRLTSR